MIPIKNLFFILCYSWGRLDEGELINASFDTVSTPQELLARVLISGTNRLLKDGLDRGYVECTEESGNLRGRISITGSISRLLFEQAKASIIYDELSHDILQNRILKTTILSLSNQESLGASLRHELASLSRRLRDVDLIRLSPAVFKRVQIHQNNAFYGFLMNLCELIFLQLTPATESGNTQFRDFSRDEVKMRRVFQDFAFNFYRLNQKEYSVTSERLTWGATGTDQDISLLPFMYTDVTLSSPSRKIILDTKYYQEAFQTNWGKSSFRSAHLYQLNTYLDCASGTVGSAKKVDGVLLYPATNDEFTSVFDIRGHTITVAAVDLRKTSTEIARRMIGILSAR